QGVQVNPVSTVVRQQPHSVVVAQNLPQAQQAVPLAPAQAGSSQQSRPGGTYVVQFGVPYYYPASPN
ncbi:hypothetical protein AAVH_38532, partial [Aphelenchoides avenae]